jgi:hypothetical protein
MLCDRYRLPDGWSPPELVTDDVVVDGVELRRAGLSSVAPTGEEVTGAAVEVTSSPIPRGSFELLERASILDALLRPQPSYELFGSDGARIGRRVAGDVFPESPDPARWRYARSNGVAIHQDWERAAEGAWLELLERDRVLRAWYGETRPVRVEGCADEGPLARTKSYEWVAYAFPEPSPPDAASRQVDVVGVFGFPETATAPLVCGYGARSGRGAALAAATREALQQLGFLWGEPVADAPPVSAPTPLFHLEHFQWPAHREGLRRWLEVGHEHLWRGTRASGPRDIGFVDLTPPWLEGGLRVAKAVADGALPLTFGDCPFATHLPCDLRTHPIA